MLKGFMHRLDKAVVVLLSVVAAITVTGLTAIIILQVFQRYVMNRSLDWPDELAGVLLAWITFTGAALVVRDNEHIGVTLLPDVLTEFWSDVIKVFCDLLVIVLLGVYLWYSFPMVTITWGQTLVTVPISRGLLFTVLPVTAAIMIGYVLAESPLTRRFRRRASDGPRSEA